MKTVEILSISPKKAPSMNMMTVWKMGMEPLTYSGLHFFNADGTISSVFLLLY